VDAGGVPVSTARRRKQEENASALRGFWQAEKKKKGATVPFLRICAVRQVSDSETELPACDKGRGGRREKSANGSASSGIHRARIEKKRGVRERCHQVNRAKRFYARKGKKGKRGGRKNSLPFSACEARKERESA